MDDALSGKAPELAAVSVQGVGLVAIDQHVLCAIAHAHLRAFGRAFGRIQMRAPQCVSVTTPEKLCFNRA